MTGRVYKYELPPIACVGPYMLKLKSEPINVAFQGERLQVWAVDVDTALERDFKFTVVWTGQDFEETRVGRFLGTTVSPAGLVYHVFYTDSLDVKR